MKKKLIIGLILLVVVGYFVKTKFFSSTTSSVQYQTAVAQKGTLINSVSATGSISAGNSTSISTSASGTVTAVYVKNGQSVISGQKLAEIKLDDDAAKRASDAYIKYLDAGVAVKQAIADRNAADVAMWTARQTIFNSHEAVDSPTKTYSESEKVAVDKGVAASQTAFDVAEQKYKNATAQISNAKISQTAAWRDYQDVSSTIYAPAAGMVANLQLAPGVVLTKSTTTTSSGSIAVNTQEIGKVENSDTQLQAKVNVTEIDVLNIKPGQKATVTVDAYSDKTFTGVVLAVNTAGTVSSGVTNYPVTILLDKTPLTIYPNMSVSVQIVTGVKDNVLLVPSSAIKNGSVQVMKNSTPTSVAVETGDTNGTQTEITSGLSEGDVVVTSTTSTSTSTSSSSSSTSIFSGLNRTRTGTGGTTRSAVFVPGGP